MNWEAGTPCAVVEPTAGYNLASRWASWAEVCSGVADQLLKDELEASNILLEEFLTGLISVKKKKNACDFSVALVMSKEDIWHHSSFSCVPLYEYVVCGYRYPGRKVTFSVIDFENEIFVFPSPSLTRHFNIKNNFKQILY